MGLTQERPQSLERRNSRHKPIPTAARGQAARTILRSFRVDADISEAINNLSEKERTSVNAVVNRALRRYVEWEVFAEKFGLQSVPSLMIARLFDFLSEKQIREIGENYGNNLAPELITFWFKKLDFTTLLKALDLLGMRYARLFHFDHVFDGKNHTLFIQHGKGAKVSIYYEATAKALLAKLGIKPEVSFTPNQVTIVIPEKEVERQETESLSR